MLRQAFSGQTQAKRLCLELFSSIFKESLVNWNGAAGAAAPLALLLLSFGGSTALPKDAVARSSVRRNSQQIQPASGQKQAFRGLFGLFGRRSAAEKPSEACFRPLHALRPLRVALKSLWGQGAMRRKALLVALPLFLGVPFVSFSAPRPSSRPV